MCMLNNSKKWRMQLKISGRHYQIGGRVLFSIMITQGPRTHLWLLGKNYWNWVGMFCHSHPPYSPDLAPSDYHLFRSMQNSLNGKIFNNADDVGSHLIQFLIAQTRHFTNGEFLLCQNDGKRSSTRTSNI